MAQHREARVDNHNRKQVVSIHHAAEAVPMQVALAVGPSPDAAVVLVFLPIQVEPVELDAVPSQGVLPILVFVVVLVVSPIRFDPVELDVAPIPGVVPTADAVDALVVSPIQGDPVKLDVVPIPGVEPTADAAGALVVWPTQVEPVAQGVDSIVDERPSRVAVPLLASVAPLVPRGV